jgi:ariadne-1
VCYFDALPLYYNICGHAFCIECWTSHLKSSVQSCSAFPHCMQNECHVPVLLETITGLLQMYGEEGAGWLKKYEKKVCELFITTNRNYQFCTGVDCGNCIKINMQLDTVLCTCGKVFCFRCQSDDHYPCKCEEKAKWMDQVMKEEADAKWISQNAKICPWCKKAV